MRHLQVASLAELARPIEGLRVLVYGLSGRGFPGGDGGHEAATVLPEVGIDAVYTWQGDPNGPAKLRRGPYDVSIVANTRVGALLEADPRIWEAAHGAALWFWDLRPGSVAGPLRGRPARVYLSFSGEWRIPRGEPYSPLQWAEALDCPVGYCPQGSPLREPIRAGAGPRVLFVGDVQNPTYHADRAALCRALDATVMNHRDRPGRLALEGKLPELYRSARYVLSVSPRAPGYTSVRTYSILACGGLMLLRRFPGSDDLFRDGEHVVTFDDVHELRGKLAELDRDEERRERIADAGRRLHATRHTVAHRVLSICRDMTGAS